MAKSGQTNQPPPEASTRYTYISYTLLSHLGMGALIAVDEETLAQLQTAVKILKKDVETVELLLNQLTQAVKQVKKT